MPNEITAAINRVKGKYSSSSTNNRALGVVKSGDNVVRCKSRSAAAKSLSSCVWPDENSSSAKALNSSRLLNSSTVRNSSSGRNPLIILSSPLSTSRSLVMVSSVPLTSRSVLSSSIVTGTAPITSAPAETTIMPKKAFKNFQYQRISLGPSSPRYVSTMRSNTFAVAFFAVIIIYHPCSPRFPSCRVLFRHRVERQRSLSLFPAYQCERVVPTRRLHASSLLSCLSRKPPTLAATSVRTVRGMCGRPPSRAKYPPAYSGSANTQITPLPCGSVMPVSRA